MIITDLKQTGKPWKEKISLIYRSFPQGGVGKGVLKFATVLAKKKWKILSMSESKVGLEKFR